MPSCEINKQHPKKNPHERDSFAVGSYTKACRKHLIFALAMKQLANRPMLLAFILAIPLWFVLDNFIVAAMAALLLAFLVSMARSLYVLKQNEQRPQKPTMATKRHEQ